MLSPSGGRRAIDVHAHAMPLPLLARLADRGLADLDGVPDGIIRLDSRVSGVGPWAPLPLARSQYDVAVRLSEMDGAGVTRHAVSLPPFLFASTSDDRPRSYRSLRIAPPMMGCCFGWRSPNGG